MTMVLRICRFVQETRAAAVGLVAVAASLMALGGGVLICDRSWLYDQRDMLDSATGAAGLAATFALARMQNDGLLDNITEAERDERLRLVAERYITLSLVSLSGDRFIKAQNTLQTTVSIDTSNRMVGAMASADLGGTIFSRYIELFGNYSGPPMVHSSRVAECSGSSLEIVLAVDVTRSMNGKIVDTEPASPSNHRLKVVISAARTLLATIQQQCPDMPLAIGIVPWDKTVKLNSPGTWISNGWVDTTRYDNDPLTPVWGGCIESRTLDLADIDATPALSLTLPDSMPIGAFHYPNTQNISTDVFDSALLQFRRGWPHMVGFLNRPVWRQAIEALIPRAGDNDGGDPNHHCTRTPILPLTTDRALADQKLAELQLLVEQPYPPHNNGLWGSGTMAHIGVTWGRRMLSHSWRPIWGDAVHPADPADGRVRKVLIVLSDGDNIAIDDMETLPGRFRGAFWFMNGAHIGHAVDQGTGGFASGRILFDNMYTTTYSAMGRLGFGSRDEERTYHPEITSDIEATDALNRLMRRSCAMAHEEGITIYSVTVGNIGGEGERNLLSCSGNSVTLSDSERQRYHYRGVDGDAIVEGFRSIAQGLISVKLVK